MAKSKRSKAADQALVSKSEFDHYRGSKAFCVTTKAISSAIVKGYEAQFGARALARLKESAKRAKQKPAAYVLNYLAK